MFRRTRARMQATTVLNHEIDLWARVARIATYDGGGPVAHTAGRFRVLQDDKSWEEMRGEVFVTTSQLGLASQRPRDNLAIPLKNSRVWESPPFEAEENGLKYTDGGFAFVVGCVEPAPGVSYVWFLVDLYRGTSLSDPGRLHSRDVAEVLRTAGRGCFQGATDEENRAGLHEDIARYLR
jgi:hypothetical protein